jgi:hypothetical protein
MAAAISQETLPHNIQGVFPEGIGVYDRQLLHSRIGENLGFFFLKR